MPVRRVFVSVTRNDQLDDRRRSVKAAIVARLENVGFEPQMFRESGLPASLSWSFDNVDRVMRRCVGAVVIGFPRWKLTDHAAAVVGEYNQYEGATAMTYRLPVLLLAERGVASRGIVWPGAGRPVEMLPADAGPDLVEDPKFAEPFNAWLESVRSRKDVFLGYCSQNAGTAALIENRLIREGATVRNYQMDFRAGVSILNEIQEAAIECSCGIFLFAENDPLEGDQDIAAPRDNVVFEAGYFMNAKGPERCLIIRQGHAKMPADLGGAIYVALDSPNDVSPIERRLSSFLEDNL